jgi:hypothetical protein
VTKLLYALLLFGVAPAAHPAHELEVLEQVLGKLSVMHVSKNVKKNAMPFNMALPQIDPKTVSALCVDSTQDTACSALAQAGRMS